MRLGFFSSSLPPASLSYGILLQVLCQLLTRFNFSYCILIVIFTVLWIKSTADSGTIFIDLTAVSTIEVFTSILHVKVPLPPLYKDGCFLVTDIPADIFKIILRCWFIKLKGKIATAERTAFFTGSTHENSSYRRSLRNIPLYGNGVADLCVIVKRVFHIQTHLVFKARLPCLHKITSTGLLDYVEERCLKDVAEHNGMKFTGPNIACGCYRIASFAEQVNTS